MYLSVVSICAQPIENAPYPSCHSNPEIAHVSRNHRDDSLLISLIALAIDMEEGKESRR